MGGGEPGATDNRDPAGALHGERRRSKVDRNRDEREFLPAALEILETPASPAGRAVAALISSLLCLALIWSWFGHIDTIAAAQGKIVPGAQVKLIQPLEVGVVREIHVREGQRVRAGDPLVDLDPTESEVDLDQIRRTLQESEMEYGRAGYSSRHLMGDPLALERPEGMDEAIFQVQRERLESELDLLGARRSGFGPAAGGWTSAPE